MVKLTCDNCGDEFERNPGNVNEDTNSFCSRDCYYDHGRPDMSGENHYDYKGGDVELTCEVCGDTYKVAPYREDSSRFCSRECKDKNLETVTGEEHNNWKGDARTTTCKECGETFRYHGSEEPTFCSQECYSEELTERMQGEGNHVWRGGWEHYYGANWDEQREAALMRDDHTCQLCGVEASELDASLHVHHEQRLGWFREEYDAPEWWEKGNKLDNLVSVCSSCHKKLEWENA